MFFAPMMTILLATGVAVLGVLSIANSRQFAASAYFASRLASVETISLPYRTGAPQVEGARVPVISSVSVSTMTVDSLPSGPSASEVASVDVPAGPTSLAHSHSA